MLDAVPSPGGKGQDEGETKLREALTPTDLLCPLHFAGELLASQCERFSRSGCCRSYGISEWRGEGRVAAWSTVGNSNTRRTGTRCAQAGAGPRVCSHRRRI